MAVPTFECLGLYWKTPAGAADKQCEARYRAAGSKDWKAAMPLWFDPRNQEYRGSIVHLRPGTSHEVSLRLEGTTMSTSLQARTWSETFPVGRTVSLPAHSSETLTITEAGLPEGYALYAGGSEPTTIDVANQADQCIAIKASYVIVRGLMLKNPRVHGILLAEGAHDVVIEGCDISGWGRIEQDGWGHDYDSAIYSKQPRVARIIIQRNTIHHPRSNSNNWKQARRPGRREPSHPEGPQAVCLWDSDGNHVIRHNTVFSDDDHQYNDVFGAGQNFSSRGFPNRDSDIYGNRLSHCWDDAIESEGANCNVRIWGNYLTEDYVGIATASTSIGPLYVWRNVNAVSRVAPGGSGGGFLKISDKMGGGRIYVFHNTVLQPTSSSASSNSLGATVGLGWGGTMTNVTSRNNILHVSRQAIVDRAHDPLGDYDYDLFSAPLATSAGQEKHGPRGAPVFVHGWGINRNVGVFALSPQSPGFDAGVILPNFNDGFNGAGPDIGAHESGTPPMQFGADARK